MKKQKNIDSLLASLENQQGALMGKGKGKSIQYWCGLSVMGGDLAGALLTGSSPDPSPGSADTCDDHEQAIHFGG